MHLIKYILVFFIFTNICFADQNDRRLDSLFDLLKNSSDYDLFYRMIVKFKMKGIATKKDEIFDSLDVWLGVKD